MFSPSNVRKRHPAVIARIVRISHKSSFIHQNTSLSCVTRNNERIGWRLLFDVSKRIIGIQLCAWVWVLVCSASTGVLKLLLSAALLALGQTIYFSNYNLGLVQVSEIRIHLKCIYGTVGQFLFALQLQKKTRRFL